MVPARSLSRTRETPPPNFASVARERRSRERCENSVLVSPASLPLGGTPRPGFEPGSRIVPATASQAAGFSDTSRGKLSSWTSIRPCTRRSGTIVRHRFRRVGASFDRSSGREYHTGSCRLQPLPGPSPPGVGPSAPAPAECACLDGYPVRFAAGCSSDPASARNASVDRRGCPQLRLDRVIASRSLPNGRTVESDASAPLSETDGDQNAAIVSRAGRPRRADPLLGDDQQARVPRPRTGSPCGGRVMRARYSGLRRKRVRRGSRRDIPSSGIRPVPHVDCIDSTGVPRLPRGEPAAERVLRSSCGNHRESTCRERFSSLL